MRLPADQLKQAILHPDEQVREVAFYFAHSFTTDETTLPLVSKPLHRNG